VQNRRGEDSDSRPDSRADSRPPRGLIRGRLAA
jgi:hypothetical protein